MPAVPHTEIERVFREEYGRAVAVLVRVFGDIDLAEEAVQDAFTTALDPVNLKLPPTSNLAISIFLPAQTIQHISPHGYADQTSYTAPGNVVRRQISRHPT